MLRFVFVSVFFISFSAKAQVMFLECPEGTKKKSVLEKDEIHEWCADKDGVRTGGYSLRASDGTPKVFVEYKNDRRDGQYVRYHANGKPAEQGQISNDEPVGEWKRFHTNGAISDIGSWKDGEPEGPWKFYHSSGKLEAEGVYEDGDRVGTWKFYDKEGKYKNDRDYDRKGLLVEGGYLLALDSSGNAHAAEFGVNWFPFSGWAEGFAFGLRFGALRAGETGDGDGDPIIQTLSPTIAHYWSFGNLLLGLQIGEAEILSSQGDGRDDTIKFQGIDTYLTVNQKWVKRYGLNLKMLENDIGVITAKAVFWEF